MNMNNNQNVSDEELLNMTSSIMHSVMNKDNNNQASFATSSEPEQSWDLESTSSQPVQQPVQSEKANIYENKSEEELGNDIIEKMKRYRQNRNNEQGQSEASFSQSGTANVYENKSEEELGNDIIEKMKSYRQRKNNNTGVDADMANRQAAEALTKQYAENIERQQERQRQADVSQWNTDRIPDETSSYNDDADCGVDIEDSVKEPCYFKDEKGQEVLNLRASQKAHAYKISPDKVKIPSTKAIGFLQRHKKLMFESQTGASYMYKIRWEALLQEAVSPYEPNMVTRFGVYNGVVQVMGRETDPTPFEDTEFGFDVYDLVDFHSVFKQLPMITELRLDEEARERLQMQYGYGSEHLWEVFKEASKLQVIQMIDGNKPGIQLRRNQFSANADKYEEVLAKDKLKAQLQYKCDTLNPRKDEMPKGRIYTIKKTEGNITKNLFGKANKMFFSEGKDWHPIWAGVATVAGVAAAGVWAGTSLIGGGIHLVKKAKDKKKQ
jgi:hypothetical protein